MDGILLQGPKAEKPLGLAGPTWGELSQQTALFPKHPWPRSASQAPVFGKCAAIPHDSPTVITVGTFQPTCPPAATACEAGPWEDLSSCAQPGAALSGASAEEHVKAEDSLFVAGVAGVGKNVLDPAAARRQPAAHAVVRQDSCSRGGSRAGRELPHARPSLQPSYHHGEPDASGHRGGR